MAEMLNELRLSPLEFITIYGYHLLQLPLAVETISVGVYNFVTKSEELKSVVETISVGVYNI